MRTTISVDDDLGAELQRYARANRISLARAAVQLVRLGLQPARYSIVNGLPQVKLPPGSPKVTSELVKQLLDEEPW